MADGSWSARIVPHGDGLVLRFSQPVRDIEMTSEVARRLAALLVVAAERRQPRPRRRAGAR